MNWYCFYQNNSGGYFYVDDKVCYRLYIESDTLDNAITKAEELGCYWNGVSRGIDCSCCGDRWDKRDVDLIDLDKYITDGYAVSVFNAEDEWYIKWGNYEIIKKPVLETRFGIKTYTGYIKIHTIEEYAQVMADEGCFCSTSPDARIYYNNGNVKEIFRTDSGISTSDV